MLLITDFDMVSVTRCQSQSAPLFHSGKLSKFSWILIVIEFTLCLLRSSVKKGSVLNNIKKNTNITAFICIFQSVFFHIVVERAHLNE